MSKLLLDLFVKDMMQPPPMVVYEEASIGDVIATLRSKEMESKIFYLYVVDASHVLKGILPTRSILVADLEEKAKDLMEDDLFSIHEDTPFRKGMEALMHHRLLALPVVNSKHQLVGFFDIQMCLEGNIDSYKVLRSQDVFQMLGTSLEISAYHHPWRAYTKRMPWILCNMIGGIACAAISYGFQEVLSKVVLLAMFIPLVLALSEAISMQSMTQSLLIIKKQKIPFKKLLLRFFFESRVSPIMSITSGAIVGALSLIWNPQLATSLVIGIGILLSVILSALMGASIPLMLHMAKLDPKVASGPIVLTCADVITTTLYLSIASWFLL